MAPTFSHVQAYPGDPILSLNEDFQKDPRSDKVNLSIGLYFDDAGKIPMLPCVEKAEALIVGEHVARSYLPMGGTLGFRTAVQELVFGPDSQAVKDGRVATLQSVAGSGALKVGSDFLKRYFPQSEVWVSDPTWENHRQVFEGSGFRVNTYPYYDTQNGGLRFDEMLSALHGLAPNSIVLLHACCHNPTGVDLTPEQWRQLIPVLQQRGLIAFVDMAYQGFGVGLNEDAYSVRAMADAGLTFLVANSFSKNFSIYSERCGGLSIVCSSAEEAARVYGQVTGTIRANYSNPPTHGAQIVTRILGTPVLRAQWEQELAEMRARIHAMRRAIHTALSAKVDSPSLARYLNQCGMFTYTGLSAEQVDKLRVDHGVYLLRSGRMCVAGLNQYNVETTARAIASVMVAGN